MNTDLRTLIISACNFLDPDHQGIGWPDPMTFDGRPMTQQARDLVAVLEAKGGEEALRLAAELERAVQKAVLSKVAFTRDNPHGLESVVVTPKLQEWAAATLPLAEAALVRAQALEAAVARSSSGEREWTENGGHRVARATSRAEDFVRWLRCLAQGYSFDPLDGGIDRRDFAALIARYPFDAE